MELIIIGAVIVIGLVVFFASRREPRAALGSAEHLRMPASPPARGDTDETVDPVAEAEVYLAYGRKEQAIEILEEALSANPSRENVRKKLNELKASK